MKIARPVVVNSALALVIVLAIAAGALVVLNPLGSGQSSVPTVQLTGTVQHGTVSSTISASGAVAPAGEITSSFAVGGTIASVAVAPGSVVTTGQTLGTLDSTPLIAALNSATASLAAARASLAYSESTLATAQSNLNTSNAAAITASRQPTGSQPNTAGSSSAAATGTSHSTSTSHGSGNSVTPAASPGVTSSGSSGAGSSGQVSLASARSQVTSAEAQVNNAQVMFTVATTTLASATLVAPVAGLVVAVYGSVGDTAKSGSISRAVTPSGAAASNAGNGAGASSGTSLGFVTIADTSQLTVTADVAETDIASVSIGQSATVNFPAMNGMTATAKITAIAPIGKTNNSVVTYPTTITLDAVPAGLRLGQTAQVVITTKTSGVGALYVPAVAITTATGVSSVKVIDSDGTAVDRTVTLGVIGDIGTQIRSGLSAGEHIVIGSVAEATTPTNPQLGRIGGRLGGGFGPRSGGGAGGGAGTR